MARHRFRKRNIDSLNCRKGGRLPTAQTFLPLLLLFCACACKPPPEQRQHMPQADAARGREVINQVGCGSCHSIPGIYWPKGQTGPSLQGFADRGLIAGRLPNQPEILAAFIRNAPALIPDTTMPAMPITEEDSRHVAAYLYAHADR